MFTVIATHTQVLKTKTSLPDNQHARRDMGSVLCFGTLWICMSAFGLSEAFESLKKADPRLRGQVATNDCDGEVALADQERGYIQLLPSPHKQFKRCSWLLKAQQGKVYELTLHKSHLLCGRDERFTVYDGDTVSAAVLLDLCGDLPPAQAVRYSSVGAVLVVVHARNTADLLLGFRQVPPFKWDAYPCDGKDALLTATGTPAVLTSPGYRDDGLGHYPNNLDCKWTIFAGANKNVFLRFLRFDLDSSRPSIETNPLLKYPELGRRSCPDDRLALYDGNDNRWRLLGEFCDDSPGYIKSTTNMVHMYLHSNSAHSRNGFKVMVEQVEFGRRNPSPNDACAPDQRPSTRDLPYGMLSTPRLHGSYASFSHCSWKIDGQGSKIQLVFTAMDVEYHPSCSFDYVLVHDGAEVSAPLLAGPLCGQDVPRVALSSSDSLVIVFKSDESREAAGFNIKWLTLAKVVGDPCSEDGALVVRQSVGMLLSPGFDSFGYSANVDCRWTIKTRQQTGILLRFLTLQIENHPTCSYDSLSVYDARQATNLLGKYCGSEPITVKTSGRFVHMVFRSDQYLQSRGFQLEFNTLDPGVENDGSLPACVDGLVLYAAESPQIVASPLHGNIYPSLSGCKWQFISPYPSKGIRLIFKKFRLEDSHECSADYVRIKTSTGRTEQYCGHRDGLQVQTTGSSLELEFVTDATEQFNGFVATMQLFTIEDLTCGHPLVPVRLGLDRIVGGNEARPHSLPWLVLLLVDGHFVCGGSVLASRWVITTAHCTYGTPTASLSVIVGAHHNTGARFLEAYRRTVSVRAKYEHPLYASSFEHDLSLLELEQPLVFNDHVQPLCIPAVDPPRGTQCLIAGWGSLSFDIEMPFSLQQAWVPLLDAQDCFATFDYFNEASICAGNFDKNICFGDSGGPLMCENNGVWYTHGLTTFTVQCGELGYPGGFTSTTHYRQWILDTTSYEVQVHHD